MNIIRSQKADKPIFMEEAEIHQALTEMALDSSLNTNNAKPGYAKKEEYPANRLPFYQKHMEYLKSHPKVNPAHYLANLRTMIKIRHR
ncbi:MAG TPA: hypothetical protein VLG37_00155 [Candidatus Saccharimonadales bacterium]|nr:hypothetical protein [Candidatus Saccharimonadales bacterium]